MPEMTWEAVGNLIQAHPMVDGVSEDHPYKAECACGQWSYVHSNHLAELIVQEFGSPEIDPADCDHEFYDHCARCGVDAHDWYNR